MDERSDSTFVSMKVVLIGASTVGKTSLVNVATDGTFQDTQAPTIGSCFVVKKIKIVKKVIRLHLWDTAGQERFRSLAPMYFRDANVALIVYAVNDQKSFEDASGWYDCMESECQTIPYLYLIGNKIDLENERNVSHDDGLSLAEKMGAQFFEVSAKEGTNVDELFQNIAEACIKIDDDYHNMVHDEKLLEKQPKEKKSCC